jgi:hypothetical protein
MRRTVTRICLLLLFALPLATTANAQSPPDPKDLESLDELSTALQVMGNRYADQYVQPLTDAMGSGMNAGLFRTAEVGGGILPGIDLYLGVSVSGALMASSNQSFTPGPNFEETIDGPGGQTLTLSIEPQDNSSGNLTLPTAFGDTEPPRADLIVEDGNGNRWTANLPPGLVETPIAPLLVPQAGIGSLFGTDLQVRYLPETRLYQYGTVGLFGVAVRHSISQYIPLFPMSLSVQGAYNEMSLGTRTLQTDRGEVSDVLDASGWAFNLQGSKSLPVLPVTFYGGLQYENFDVDYSYVFTPANTGGFESRGATDELDSFELSLSQSAANKFRGLAGVSVTLAMVRLNVDYALAANDAITFGLGVKL